MNMLTMRLFIAKLLTLLEILVMVWRNKEVDVWRGVTLQSFTDLQCSKGDIQDFILINNK